MKGHEVSGDWPSHHSPRSSIEVLKADYAEADRFPCAAFDVMDIEAVPAAESYCCAAFQIVEVGPVIASRRQIRVVGLDGSGARSVLVIQSYGF